jgi:hypothetical protein
MSHHPRVRRRATVLAASFAATVPKHRGCACSSHLGVTEATLREVEPFRAVLATGSAEAVGSVRKTI